MTDTETLPPVVDQIRKYHFAAGAAIGSVSSTLLLSWWHGFGDSTLWLMGGLIILFVGWAVKRQADEYRKSDA